MRDDVRKISAVLAKRDESSGLDAKRLLAVRGKSDATTTAYRAGVKGFIAWSSAAGASLDVVSLAQYIKGLRSSGASASKVSLYLAGNRAAMLQAAEKGGMAAREIAILKTALLQIQGAKPNPPDVKVVTGEERAAMLAAMGKKSRLIARFLYATAARVSEALDARRRDCKVEGERVRIRLHGKGQRDRIVRIPADLFQEIERVFGSRKKTREYVFETGSGKRYLRQYVTKVVAKAARVALGRKLSPHVLRHARATDIYLRTRDVKGLAEFLGHKEASTTTKYYVRSKLSDADLFEGVDL